jgi:alcohol dehydrogenase class IV
MIFIKPKSTKFYKMPTEVYFGREILLKAPRILKAKKELKKGLLINGSHLSNDSYFSKFLLDLSKFIEIIQYPFKISKSNFSSINKLTDFCRYREFNFILAVGGGTILDTAKCAAILSLNKGKIEDYVKTKTKVLQNNGLFFVAILTTAGTGSEVSPWATVWGNDYKKYSLSSSQFMFPDVSFVDPALADLLPSYETATSGIDALCQAIESYWSVNHNPVSDKYALEAIRIINYNLEPAVNMPNKKFRNKMAWGSLLSGLAFSNTQTTICHAVSYPISIHWKVAHGQATSLTLPVFFEYIVPALPIARQKKLLKAIGSKTISKAADKIRKLMINIGLKTSFRELNISRKDINTITKEGFHPDRMKNSPLIPSFQELKHLLESIL